MLALQQEIVNDVIIYVIIFQYVERINFSESISQRHIYRIIYILADISNFIN